MSLPRYFALIAVVSALVAGTVHGRQNGQRGAGFGLACMLSGGADCTMTGSATLQAVDIRGAVTNGGAANSGRVYVSDGLEVTGGIVTSANTGVSVGGSISYGFQGVFHTAATAAFTSAVSNTMSVASSLNPSYYLCSCTSGTNCPFTLDGAAAQGQRIMIVQTTAQQCVLGSSGTGLTAVTLPGGAATLTLNRGDVIELVLASALTNAWVTTNFSDNSP